MIHLNTIMGQYVMAGGQAGICSYKLEWNNKPLS